jgi:hypothetical protein
VFLNRALTDEVREWYTPSRLVVSGELKGVSLSGVGGESAQLAVPGQGAKAETAVAAKEIKVKGGPGSFYEQAHAELEERGLPPEDWMWQFEESFLGEFLRAKAVIVDRATIVRLIAAQGGKQGDAHDLLSVKTVEMDAVKEKADMFMELLVRRNPASPVGYEFKATVKEVSTGRILANVSSLEWKQRELDDLTGKKYRATDRGYVAVDEGTFPKLDRVAAMLALDVMDALVYIWSPDEGER